MNCEKLISLVEGLAALWDQKNKEYHNRDTVKKLWEHIGKEMNERDDKVRQKWRGLRDTFRKELTKCKQICNDGTASERRPKWQYFNRLMFLRDQFQFQTKGTNISFEQKDMNQSDAEIILPGLNEPESDDLDSSYETTVQTDFENTSNSFKRKRTDRNDPLRPLTPVMKCEQENMKNFPQKCEEKDDDDYHSENTSNSFKRKRTDRNGSLRALTPLMKCDQDNMKNFPQKSEEKDDDDYHFAMSIVPFLRNVVPCKKLRLRTRIQQMIQEELYDSEAHLCDYIQ